MTLTSTYTLNNHNNGTQIPVLGLGVYPSPVGEDTQKAVQYALNAGYRHIDTAKIYRNEQDVGKAMEQGLKDGKAKAIGIPKSNNEHRIIENASVFDFAISTEDMAFLDSLNENLATGWDPTGAP